MNKHLILKSLKLKFQIIAVSKAAGCGAEKSLEQWMRLCGTLEVQPVSLIQMIQSQPQMKLFKYLILFMKNEWLLVIITASFHVEFKQPIEKESAFNVAVWIMLLQ